MFDTQILLPTIIANWNVHFLNRNLHLINVINKESELKWFVLGIFSNK